MTIPALSDLRIKLFADGADLAGMVEMASKDYIQGLTTNPTLMKKVGITDYVKFARDVLNEVHTKPISFEVFSDEIEEMKAQGEKIAAWGSNVYVKVPITNTRGESMQPVVQYLSANGVKVNVTALMTVDQVKIVLQALNPLVPSCISIFAGRIADTGRNPIPIIIESLQLLKDFPACELIWASPRELLNIFQGDEIGCHVITATSDILNKLTLVGKDLESYSLDTVKMFRRDALESGFKL
jgi:transaldolase